VIAVAGTNGKGSTVEALGFLLRQTDWTVGQYTSPHLHHITERIRIAGEPVEATVLSEALDHVESARDGVDLTYFEYLTLAAFWIFQMHAVDCWVCEIGLGGRLDAVNILDADVAIITSIGLDHQAYLGDTLDAIAREKAGVMRPNQCVWTAAHNVRETLEACATACGANLQWCDASTCQLDPLLAGQWDGLGQARLPRDSLILAFKALQSLDRLPAVVPWDALAALEMPGRLTRRCVAGVQWMCDVGHNPDAAAYVVDHVQSMTVPGRRVLIMGLLQDKAAAAVIDVLAAPAMFDQIVTVDLPGPRGQSGMELARLWEARLPKTPIESFATLADAISSIEPTLNAGDHVLIFGSFLLVADALTHDKFN
jgi:dihydrofolate synthase/folylpolyglutamate synthase